MIYFKDFLNSDKDRYKSNPYKMLNRITVNISGVPTSVKRKYGTFSGVPNKTEPKWELRPGQSETGLINNLFPYRLLK